MQRSPRQNLSVQIVLLRHSKTAYNPPAPSGSDLAIVLIIDRHSYWQNHMNIW